MFFILINATIIGMMSAGIFLWEGQYGPGSALLGFSMLLAGGIFRWREKKAKEAGQKDESCCDSCDLIPAGCDICDFIPDVCDLVPDCGDSIPDCNCDHIPDCDCSNCN